MKKGQVSIEFMLLIVFILVFLGATVFPSIDLSVSAVRDIRGVAESRLAAEKIANTAESLKGQSISARETITINIPKNASIDCQAVAPPQPPKISFTYNLEGPATTACPDKICIKEFSLTGPLACSGFPIQGPQTASVVISKAANATLVTRT